MQWRKKYVGGLHRGGAVKKPSAELWSITNTYTAVLHAKCASVFCLLTPHTLAHSTAPAAAAVTTNSAALAAALPWW